MYIHRLGDQGSKILDEPLYNSNCSIAPWKGMNPNFDPPAMGK